MDIHAEAMREAIIKNMTPSLESRPSSMMAGYTIIEFSRGAQWTVERLLRVLDDLDIEYLELAWSNRDKYTFQTKQGDLVLTTLALHGL